jgi:hypothetical protein
MVGKWNAKLNGSKQGQLISVQAGNLTSDKFFKLKPNQVRRLYFQERYGSSEQQGYPVFKLWVVLSDTISLVQFSLAHSI